jgi:hypothetical protein
MRERAEGSLKREAGRGSLEGRSLKRKRVSRKRVLEEDTGIGVLEERRWKRKREVGRGKLEEES